MTLPRLALLPAVALTACAAAGPTPREPAPHAASAPRPPAAPAPWVLRVPPPLDALTPRTVCDADSPGSAPGGIIGPWRFRNDGEVRLAGDAPLAALVACARRDDGGWLFATADGALLRAASFLGPLERVGDSGGEALARGLASAGVLVVRGASGRILLGRASGRFEPAPAPAPSSAGGFASVAFGDERTGLGVTSPGVLWLTRDGGASFAGVDHGGLGLLGVTYAAGRLRVEATTDVASLPAAAAVDADVVPGADRDPTGYDFAPSRQFLHTVLTRGPERHAAALASARAVLADGTALFVLPGPSDDAPSRLLAVLPDGAAVDRDLPDGLRCDVAAWNRRALLRCAGPDDRARFFAGTAPFTAPWEPVDFDPSPAHRGMAVAPDGPLALLAGPCARGRDGADAGVPSEEERPREFCWFDGSAWHSERIEFPGRVLALRGARALAGRVGPQETMDPSGEPAVVVLDFTPEGVRVRPLDAGPGFVSSVGLLEGGAWVAGVVMDERGEAREGFAGPPEGPFERVALPEGARQAAFATRYRGLAAGADASRLWATEDGGHSWQHLDAPVDGAAQNRSYLFECRGQSEDAFLCQMGNLAMPVVACAENYCTVNAATVWAAGEFLPEPPGSVVASEHAVAPAAAPASTPSQPAGLAVAADLGDVTCNERDRPPEEPSPQNAMAALIGSMARTVTSERAGRHVTVDGALEWSVTRTGEREQYALRWSGTEGRRAYAARASGGALPPVPGAAAGGDAPRLSAFALRRTGAVIERCAAGDGSYGDRCDVIIAAAGAAPVSVRMDEAFARLPGELRVNGSPRLVAALPLAAGRWALHFRQARVSVNTFDDVYWNVGRIDDVVVVDAAGSVSARRAFVWPPGGVGGRFLAVRGDGEPGLLALEFEGDASRAVFYRLDARDAGTAVSTPLGGHVPPCAPGPRAASGPAPLVAVASTGSYATLPRAGDGWLLGDGEREEQPAVRTVLEVRPDAVCFREVRAREAGGGAAPREVRYVAGGGAAQVDVATEHGVRRVRCGYRPPG